MSAVPGDTRREDEVTLEINGVTCTARRGETVIEAADSVGISIPRFCYHKKLSVAANCRMCMVEVEKVPKPLPACATPVADGMKVFTRSSKALDAQIGTMEFLLINHPLDCPICDEGGECELQEVSLGYGRDLSRYDLPKRVVHDEDIGPLIETEMTRCIHCTRCVRFGTEIAGIRELGATGRGEHMRIGTYVARTVESELSGNVIDICPVGALTSKPFRFKARAWELDKRASVSPHDCIGTNVTLRTRAGAVMRCDPRENEAINECWIADRDRYSYEALLGADRLEQPQMKRDGRWVEVDWNTALEAVVARLRAAVGTAPEGLGTLVSPGSTLEEMYLAQRLARAFGSQNVDHRLRQTDFRDQESAPQFPWLGQSLEALAAADAVLLVGSYTRKDQPMLAHRLRQSALRGEAIMYINPAAWEFNYPVTENIAAGAAMARSLAAVAAALFERTGGKPPAGYDRLLAGVEPGDGERRIAERLAAAERPAIVLGDLASMHPDYSILSALAQLVARAAGGKAGYLTPGANAAGAWLAGAVPHRAPGGEGAPGGGLHALDMFERRLPAYLLLNLEPEYDCADPALAIEALKAAQCVVALTPFQSEAMREYADFMLPVGPFTETGGTFVNVEGRWQSFEGAARPPGESRPAWKVLRVLGNLLDLPGFEYMSVEDIREELRHEIGEVAAPDDAEWSCPRDLGAEAGGVTRIGHVPIYAVDGIVRRAEALQRTPDARRAPAAVIGTGLAASLGLRSGGRATVTQGGRTVELPVVVSDIVPAGSVIVPAGIAETRTLGRLFAPIEVAAGAAP